MVRTTRRPTVLVALLLCIGLVVATVGSSPAQASKRCKSVLTDGGRLSNLVVTGTGCTTARTSRCRSTAASSSASGAA